MLVMHGHLLQHHCPGLHHRLHPHHVIISVMTMLVTINGNMMVIGIVLIINNEKSNDVDGDDGVESITNRWCGVSADGEDDGVLTRMMATKLT